MTGSGTGQGVAVEKKSPFVRFRGSTERRQRRSQTHEESEEKRENGFMEKKGGGGEPDRKLREIIFQISRSYVHS